MRTMKKSYKSLKEAVNWYYNRAAMAYTNTPSGLIPNINMAR